MDGNFSLGGFVNKQNYCTWGSENTYVIEERLKCIKEWSKITSKESMLATHATHGGHLNDVVFHI